jgi:hypothetical protein
MKILLALIIICFVTAFFGFQVNVLIQKSAPSVATSDFATLSVQGHYVTPNGGGGDPVDGPGVPC